LLQENIALPYTPRKFVKHPEHPLFYVIEADNNVLAPATRQKLLTDSTAVNGDATPLSPQEFGYPRGAGHWASCIQIIDPVTTKSVVFNIDLEDNECATSLAVAPFAGQDDEAFLVVGTAKDLQDFCMSIASTTMGKNLNSFTKQKWNSPPQLCWRSKADYWQASVPT
jgi:splicing factor 3B subunit 3